MINPLIIKSKLSSDYFTDSGIHTITGLPPKLFDRIIIKELIDNSLDAIRFLPKKTITIDLYLHKNYTTFRIQDSGPGISYQTLKDIYLFDSYVSSKRHFPAVSCGQQGVGLKCVIGICTIRNWNLTWHTNDGIIVTFDRYADDQSFIPVDKGATNICGIEISIPSSDAEQFLNTLTYFWRQYIFGNPDINWESNYFKNTDVTKQISKVQKCDVSFFRNFDQFQSMILEYKNADPNIGEMTYRQFIERYFGKYLADVKPSFGKKVKLKDMDFSDLHFRENFENMRLLQPKKRYTLLKQHMVWTGEKEKVVCIEDSKTGLPCVIEISVSSSSRERCKKNPCPHGYILVNNSPVYHTGLIFFNEGEYSIGARKAEKTDRLWDILKVYDDLNIDIHFISPSFQFKNHGKTQLDISGVIEPLCAALKKKISSVLKDERKKKESEESAYDKIRRHLDNAFEIMSDKGRYNVTARQLYYKVRELANFVEKANTYDYFTQNIITKWIDDHPLYKNKIHFSDRGVAYVNGQRIGVGTSNVLQLIDKDQWTSNSILIRGPKTDASTTIISDFSSEKKYDKVLYIEKGGFDAMLMSEHIDEKYNLILVSGQGFGTRSAKLLLKHFADRGMKIYCLHDLDIAGCNIASALSKKNEKFDYDLPVIDLGITPEDIQYYDIVPERIPMPAEDKLKQIPNEHQKFFLKYKKEGKLQRAELSALTTSQLLDLLDRKFNEQNLYLPFISAKDTIRLDSLSLMDEALTNVLKEKFGHLLKHMVINETLVPDTYFTAEELLTEAVKIKEKIIKDLEDQLRSKL